MPAAIVIDFGSVQGEEKDPDLVKAAFEDFMKADAVQPFLASNYGFAIFPTIGKAGIGVGGAHGKGWVFKGRKSTGVTSMTQVTIGFQLGGQAYSQLIFFEDQRAYDSFTSGNFEFGAQASAVAITAGANASASTAGGTSAAAGNSQTKADYSMGMAVFTRAKGGLMYEATLGGQKFSFKAYE
ncbi:MAG: lipid-binding SYLF domain-containing protein [Opitutaceae bacterium]